MKPCEIGTIRVELEWEGVSKKTDIKISPLTQQQIINTLVQVLEMQPEIIEYPAEILVKFVFSVDVGIRQAESRLSLNDDESDFIKELRDDLAKEWRRNDPDDLGF